MWHIEGTGKRKHFWPGAEDVRTSDSGAFTGRITNRNTSTVCGRSREILTDSLPVQGRAEC